MSLLINLNQEGFLGIKNDREKIKLKIKDLSSDIASLQSEVKQLQEMLSEFEAAYERLKDFYEPKIKIKRVKVGKDEIYQSIVSFKYPTRSLIVVNLGKVRDFTGDDDKSLITLAETKIKEKIKEKHPLYF